jgi:hypothetical protein
MSMQAIVDKAIEEAAAINRGMIKRIMLLPATLEVAERVVAAANALSVVGVDTSVATFEALYGGGAARVVITDGANGVLGAAYRYLRSQGYKRGYVSADGSQGHYATAFEGPQEETIYLAASFPNCKVKQIGHEMVKVPKYAINCGLDNNDLVNQIKAVEQETE